jgi:hypothetical protein
MRPGPQVQSYRPPKVSLNDYSLHTRVAQECPCQQDMSDRGVAKYWTSSHCARIKPQTDLPASVERTYVVAASIAPGISIGSRQTKQRPISWG